MFNQLVRKELMVSKETMTKRVEIEKTLKNTNPEEMNLCISNQHQILEWYKSIGRVDVQTTYWNTLANPWKGGCCYTLKYKQHMQIP